MAKTPDEGLATMIANLAKNTGHTLEQWVARARKPKLARHGEIVAHLKSEYGLGHGYANLVAQTALGTITAGPGATASGDELIDRQYAGVKAPLRPLYDLLAKKIGAFGADVDFSAKKAYVSLRRAKQFGLIQPSTATRLDVGINLKGVPAAGRLEASGGWNAMVSHRVRVESKGDIDAELIAWLRQAYDVAG